MTWQIQLNNNHENSGEPCLTLQRSSRPQPFRSWFGPLAIQMLTQLQHKFNWPHNQKQVINKQLAQYILMFASFYHQRCLHQYQVNIDISAKRLSNPSETAELLLFIRMTDQHPSATALIQFVEQQLPWCTDMEANLTQLVEAKLIQRISYQDHVFYDKNPYPHDHILDLSKNKLADFNTFIPIKPQQQVILHSVI